MMFVASYANGVGNAAEAFDTEREAEDWLAEQLRKTGSRMGVVYEMAEPC